MGYKHKVKLINHDMGVDGPQAHGDFETWV